MSIKICLNRFPSQQVHNYFMSKILSAFQISQGKMQVVWLNNQTQYLKCTWFSQEF